MYFHSKIILQILQNKNFFFQCFNLKNYLTFDYAIKIKNYQYTKLFLFEQSIFEQPLCIKADKFASSG